MRSSLDCISCFIRQALEAGRAVSDDPALHETVVREMLLWMSQADLSQSPPSFAQHIHRRLRAAIGDGDPYRAAKDRHNQMALDLLPELRTMITQSHDPLRTAVRLAVAGNAIDMGIEADISESDLRGAIDLALDHPVCGEPDAFRRAVDRARDILYIADNAGEIALDVLLVEQLGGQRVTVAVRGAPVLNDATLEDARAVGLEAIADVVPNGSDAPGTILADCSEDFRRRFAQADLVIAKGQGNYESLNDEPGNIFFLFKVKCHVIAQQVGEPIGTHMLTRWPRRSAARREDET